MGLQTSTIQTKISGDDNSMTKTTKSFTSGGQAEWIVKDGQKTLISHSTFGDRNIDAPASGATPSVISGDDNITTIKLGDKQDESSKSIISKQITRRIVKRKRVIRKITIINGVEHVTEEVIEEPVEIDTQFTEDGGLDRQPDRHVSEIAMTAPMSIAPEESDKTYPHSGVEITEMKDTDLEDIQKKAEEESQEKWKKIPIDIKKNQTVVSAADDSYDIVVNVDPAHISKDDDGDLSEPFIQIEKVFKTKSELSKKSIEEKTDQKLWTVEIPIERLDKISENKQSKEISIKLTLHKARKLEKKGFFGKADPYSVLTLGKEHFKTDTANNNLNPEWNYSMKFNTTKDTKQEINIEVFDEDYGKDDRLGDTTIPINQIIQNKRMVNTWIPLQNCKSGEVLISAECIEPDDKLDAPVSDVQKM